MFLQRLKLRAPVVSPSWVDRAALLAAFRPGVRVLGIVAGPGYGKTVLASQLAAAWRGPTFWYGCDDTDADLAVFAAHLAALTSGGDVPSAPPATPKEVGANAAQALSALENALVVFDDVHALHGRSLAALSDLVERATSAGVSFVLCGRSLPLPVHGLAARGSYASLSATDLAFDEDRSRAYLGAASGGRLSADRIADFARRIEGWPVGLALAASMPALDHDDVSFDNAASLEILFEYFAAEVLDGLDEDDRRFLLETSVLEHLEADACDAVAATDDARDRLARLVRRGLFIARNRSDAFDIHRLFLAFLRDRLAKEYGAAEREILHERAAAFFAARRDDVVAIEHLIAANRRDRAAETLARCALALFASGRTAQLERLLADLGDDRVRAEPVLAIARGRVLQATGAWDQALAILARAEAAARARADHDVVAEAVRAMAPMLGARGEHVRLRALLDGALALELSERMRATISVTLGAHLLDNGRFDEVLELYARVGPAVAELDDLALHGIVLHNTGVAHMRRGDPFEALTFYERALVVKRAAGQRVSALVTLGNLCVTLRALGDVEAARRTSDACTLEARAVGNASMVAHALENAGALALDGGDLAAAAAAFEEARAACDPSDTSFLPDALHGIASVALHRRDAAAAITACARAAALLRSDGDEQRRAGVLVTQGRALLVAGDAPGALELARGAIALADRGADVLTTATLGLDCAALVAAVLPLLPHERADDARASGREMANAALALIATRTYHFLERTKADALAAARTLASAVTAVPALRVEVFGTMRVFAEGAELDASVWKRRRAREIFAYLVCERGRLVPRSRMIDTFWPDSDADSASDNLRVAISAIRRAVGDVVRYEAGGYRFTPPADTVIDLERFDAALSRARIARDAGDGATARAAYEAAVATYGGDLLDGFDDATWHLRERDRLRDGTLEAARAVATDPSAAEGIRATAIDRLLDLAPFDVEAMRVRLERLTAARRVGEARSEYERWQKRYADAFGNAPPEFWQAPRLVAIAPRAS